MTKSKKKDSCYASLKVAINSMYGAMISGSKIPSKYFRPIQRRLKIAKILENE